MISAGKVFWHIRLIIMIRTADTSSTWVAQPDSFVLTRANRVLHEIRIEGGLRQQRRLGESAERCFGAWDT